MLTKSFEKELDLNGIVYKKQYELKGASTFRVGGCCSIALFPKSADELAKCVSLADISDMPMKVMGRGSNTLFGDGDIDLCLIFTSNVGAVAINGRNIRCEAGAPLMSLSSAAARAGLAGLEFACGIPGSVGGAVYMNAGAHGGCMADVVCETVAYDRRKGYTVSICEHGFGYRESVYKKRDELICLEATLDMSDGDSSAIQEKMRELLRTRREKQPLEYPSAGSYFKRPEGDFAGRLIEVCGLKGMTVGGAQVSVKHAGFIINRGGATFEDIMRLEELVKSKVYAETGVMLEREVEIIV